MFGSLVPYQCGEIAIDVFGGRGGGIIRKMKCPERWCKKRACDIGETDSGWIEYSNASDPPFYRLRATSDFNTLEPPQTQDIVMEP